MDKKLEEKTKGLVRLMEKRDEKPKETANYVLHVMKLRLNQSERYKNVADELSKGLEFCKDYFRTLADMAENEQQMAEAVKNNASYEFDAKNFYTKN